MTPEEIIKTWRGLGRTDEEFRSFHYDFARAIEVAIEAATIERCAKVCDEVAARRSTNEMQVGARLCVDAIRALAKEKS